MRASRSRGLIRALAIAGTHVVVLGWNATAATVRSRGILGFGIERRRHLVEDTSWIRGSFDRGSARALRRAYFSGGATRG